MLNFLKNRIFEIHTLTRGLCAPDRPTFQQIIANIEREHFGNNATISHYRYGWFRSLLGWMGKKFQSTLVIIISIYTGFSFLLYLPEEIVELLNHIITHGDEKVRFLIDFLEDLVNKIDALCSDQTKHLPLSSFLSEGSINEDFNKQASDIKSLLNACQKILIAKDNS